MRDFIYRFEDWLPFLAGIGFGLIVGAERRLRFKAERDLAEQERDELACGMVAGIDGGRFRIAEQRTGR